jgi:hypothetical protein
MRACSRDSGPSVVVEARALGPRDGYLWMVDANEKDQLGALVCRCVAEFLRSIDILSTDVGSLISRVDREILPEAAREWRVPGLAASMLIVRVSREVVTIGHVGEIRARLFDQSGRTIHVTREDNAFNVVPGSVWPQYLIRSERDAKETILAVVGGGTAVPTVVEVAQPSSGALFASSHLWHRYATMELPESSNLGSLEQPPPMTDGQATGLLRWGE